MTAKHRPAVVDHFYTDLVTKELQPEELPAGMKWEEGGLAQVVQRFVSVYLLANGRAVVTELLPGFVFNFRSGPAMVDMVLPKRGKASPVWATHDGQYSHPKLPRPLVDHLMAEGLRLEGFGEARAMLGWRFVRWFGSGAYKQSQPWRVVVRWGTVLDAVPPVGFQWVPRDGR